MIYHINVSKWDKSSCIGFEVNCDEMTDMEIMDRIKAALKETRVETIFADDVEIKVHRNADKIKTKR